MACPYCQSDSTCSDLNIVRVFPGRAQKIIHYCFDCKRTWTTKE